MNHKSCLLRLTITAWLMFTLFAVSNAQHTQMFTGLNARSFVDGSLFKFTHSGSQDGSARTETIRVNATLSLNGKPIAKQSGAATPEAAGILMGASVQILSTQVLDPQLNEATLFGGLLPEGQYTLCVEIPGTDKACSEFVHQVRPNPVDIRLMTPADGSVLKVKSPLLAWTSVHAPAMIPGLSYELEVAERTPSQRSTTYNMMGQRKVFRQGELQQNTLIYPVGAQPLETGKEYTWNVVLKSGKYVLARSEVWQFTLEESAELNDLPIAASYIDISAINDSPEYYFMESMKLKYQPVRATEKVAIRILDEDGKAVKLKTKEIEFSRANPRVEFSMIKESRIHHMKRYTVELTPATGKVVRFTMVYVNPLFVNP